MASKNGWERFCMVKARHAQTFEKAVQEKKADAKTLSLCRFLNQHPFFFTASSCSGRIVLLELDKQETKRKAAFFFKKHGKVNATSLWQKLCKKTRGTLWFKQEPFILHIGTNSLENANCLLNCAHKAGIKRAGIIVAKPGKFVLEIIGTHGMALPIKQKAKIVVEKSFFFLLVRIANQKLLLNFERLKRFEKTLRKEMEKKT